MATKLFTVSLCRESRHISSSQNFLFYLYLILRRSLVTQALVKEAEIVPGNSDSHSWELRQMCEYGDR